MKKNNLSLKFSRYKKIIMFGKHLSQFTAYLYIIYTSGRAINDALLYFFFGTEQFFYLRIILGWMPQISFGFVFLLFAKCLPVFVQILEEYETTI